MNKDVYTSLRENHKGEWYMMTGSPERRLIFFAPKRKSEIKCKSLWIKIASGVLLYRLLCEGVTFNLIHAAMMPHMTFLLT